MNEQITINEEELVEYISDKASEQGLTLTHKTVQIVLDLEFEFLRLKGVIE